MINTTNIEIKNARLSKEIRTWLKEHKLAPYTSLFYNGSHYQWSKKTNDWVRSDGWISDYCPYSPDETLGIIFEGVFYDLIHYYPSPHPLLEGFDALFKRFGLDYELSHTWALSVVEAVPA